MKNILKNLSENSFSGTSWLKPVILAGAGFAWLTTAAQGQLLYSDNFSRTTNPAPITPWLEPASVPAAWEINNGTMQGGPNTSGDYGYVYVTNTFTNVSIQAQVRFSTSNAWGGGIGGYLNTNTGAHYAAWLYPENSAGGGPAVRLVKFSTWTSFEYETTNFAFMAVTNVASVGTNQHTLRLAFTNQTIQVFYDGNQVISTTDGEATPYTNGAVSLDMYTDATAYLMNVADAEVAVQSSIPLAVSGSYSAASGSQLSVAAPGVLTLATDGQGPLTAVLATNAAHGTLSLSNNGGFTYTPTAGFSGADTFAYEAYDGHNDSAPAIVTINVSADIPPIAYNQSYTLIGDTTLTVAPPGILTNDTDSDSQPLTAILASEPTNGTLNLTNNGGFSYTPSNNFSGTDTFTYKANDGISNSTPATVTLTVLPTTTLFYDNFAAGQLAPWVVETGNWTVAGGALISSLNSAGSYGFAYLTNVWTNFSIQGQVEFAADSYGGGIGGRLTSATGAHYAAWVYPEGSPGGGPELRLVKFLNYTTFGYPAPDDNFEFMAATNLTAVGTGLHTVKLGFFGTQIAVYFDGTQMMSVTDTDATTYPSGGVSADTYSGSTSDELSVENVTVSDLVNNGFYTVLGGNTLSVAAPGVLTGDTPVFTSSLTASVMTGPAHGSLTLTNNGGFSYTPNGGFGGQDSFTYQANDGSTNLGTATVYINVIYNGPSSLVFTENFDEVTAPALPTGWTTTATGIETNWVTTTVSNNTSPNSAFVPDVTNIGLSELVSPTISLPAGPCQLTFKNNYNLEIDTTNSTDGYDGGVLEIKIGTNAFTDVIAAGGSFLAGGYNTIINTTFGNPLAGRAAWSGSSGGFITTTVDLPPAASGQSVQLRWDCGTDNSNAKVGWWIDTISISNCPTAVCWNTAPVLPAPTNVTVNEQTLLTVTNTVSSPGEPTNTVTYSLLSPPSGATINSAGVITWTPSQSESPSTNTITTRVVNSGTPALSATNSFTVFVKEVNIAPVLPAQTNETNAGLATLTVTNTATEPNIHATTTGYDLTSAPAGMTISAGGIITWTPTVSQVPSTNTVTTVATNKDSFDTVNPILTATNTFTVVAATVHNGPSLPTQSTVTNNELVQLIVTNTASDSDVPVLTLAYSLTSAPGGASISTNGVITWTPSQTESPSTNLVTTVVTDSGSPAKSATNSFTVVVKEINVAPVLPVISTQTVDEQTLLTVTNTATESNIHSVVTNYTLVSPLAGMSIDTNGIFTWTPTQAQSPSTNTVTVLVANTNAFDKVNPVLKATNTFTVIVKEINIAPTLPVISTQTVNEQTLLTVTNTATESDIHAVTTGYSLISPLAGMSISTNGIFTWTPAQGQSPGTNTVTTVVTNKDSFDTVNPILTATNTFTVIVKEINIAPTLPVISTQTVNEQILLTVTNTATEPNIHAMTTGYSLISPLAGMSISTNGIFTWTPTQSQSPSTNTVTTVVTNNDSFDSVNPVLTATNTFTVIVKEINIAPTLPVIGTQTVNEQTLLTVTNTATEPNIHSVTTGYSLVSPLAGMSISTNGIFTWTPTQSQSPGTNTITTVVANTNAYDQVNPVLKTTNTFTVIVKEINIAPTLPVIGTQTVNEQTLLTVTNTATEPNIHAMTTGYSLVSPLLGMSIDTNGIFTWTPSQNQSPGTNTITVVVTNNDVYDSVNPTLTATNSFTVIVKEVNIAPILPVITTQTVNEQTLLTVTNTATEPNIHAVTTGYGLVNALLGMNIDTNGIFTWTPSQSQSPGTNIVTVLVINNDPYDTVNPTLTATNMFMVIVKEINIAPTLPVISTQTVNELTLLTVTNTATEPNIHAVTTGYGLVSPLLGMNIDTNGIFTWTPSQSQSPGTNTVTVVATNSDTYDTVNPTLTATNTFTVIVKEINIAPILPVIGTQTIAANSLLTVTNTATEPNIHAVTTGYGLANAPAGASISAGGIFTWTPLTAGTNTITTVVTNNDSYDLVNPTLMATNSFTVVVTSSTNNPPPVIQSTVVSGGNIILTWSAVPGGSYQVQYSTNISISNWSNIAPNVTASGTTASITNATGTSPQQFYRIILLP